MFGAPVQFFLDFGDVHRVAEVVAFAVFDVLDELFEGVGVLFCFFSNFFDKGMDEL